MHRVAELTLQPGWLKRDADRAQHRMREWHPVEFTCRKCGYTWRARFADKCLSCEHVYLTRKP